MDTITKVLVLLAVVLALVVITLIVVVWSKFSALPGGAKALVVIAISLVALTMALTFGWVLKTELEAAGIPTSLASASAKATDLWTRFDALTRDYPLYGILMLCSLPVIFWPSGDTDA